MKVSELIEALKALPQHYDVAVDLNTEDSGSYSDFVIDHDGDAEMGLVYFTPNDL